MDFDSKLATVNAHLENVQIRARGGKLTVRGTFPPKPGHTKRDRHDIATGCNATLAGLKVAKTIAHRIDGELLLGAFDWGNYLPKKQDAPISIGDYIDRFYIDHWINRSINLKTKNSYHKDYELKFRHLPEDEPLTLEVLKRVIYDRTEPGTRSRQGYAMAFRRLAEFAELAGADELKAIGKGYSSGSVVPRNLPSDGAIAAAVGKFPSEWRWAYVAMAIWGIRPHEVFRLGYDRLRSDPRRLEVLEDSKTGNRLAYPMMSRELLDRFVAGDFELSPRLPNVATEGRNNNQLGMKITQKFKQVKVGFTPYALRHSYARRGYEMGFPPEFLSRSLGHSYEVHCRIYQAWIGEDSDLKLYRSIVGKETISFGSPGQS